VVLSHSVTKPRKALRVAGSLPVGAVLLGCAVLSAASGCAPVRPWEREHLAKRCMTRRFGEDGTQGEYQAKVTESVTGGGLAGDAPGGGCGCTQ